MIKLKAGQTLKFRDALGQIKKARVIEFTQTKIRVKLTGLLQWEYVIDYKDLVG